ncbi:MAG: HAD family hydrolase [Saprospiraceae bacterium]
MYLFLDRDGVINVRTVGDYITRPEDFHFLNNSDQAIARLRPLFERIVVVTNQAGIRKNRMQAADVDRVHAHMQDALANLGVRLDHVFYCPHKPDDKCNCRKPEVGMALEAQRTFPEISFEKSWMVGDSVSDIELGLRLGMRTVLIHGKDEESQQLDSMPVDLRFDALIDFADYLETHPDLLK